MATELFKDRFRVPSARAAWHDYNGGIYFVTICTAGREHYFGEITDGEMHLSAIGEYTRQCIENITQHNPYANVPLFVIMPNHLHLIVVIDDTNGCRRDAPWHVSTDNNLKFRVFRAFRGNYEISVFFVNSVVNFGLLCLSDNLYYVK